MVPQPLTTLHGAKIAYQAVAAAAHAGEPAIFPCQHFASMHCRAIPSILDTNRFRFVLPGTNRGRAFTLRHTLTKQNFLTPSRAVLPRYFLLRPALMLVINPADTQAMVSASRCARLPFGQCFLNPAANGLGGATLPFEQPHLIPQTDDLSLFTYVHRDSLRGIHM